MFSPNEIRRYCNQLKTSAQQEKDRLLAERQKIDAKLTQTKATLVRLDAPFPDGDYCPLCFYNSGILSRVRPIGAPPERPRVDAFRCAREHYFENGKIA